MPPEGSFKTPKLTVAHTMSVTLTSAQNIVQPFLLMESITLILKIHKRRPTSQVPKFPHWIVLTSSGLVDAEAWRVKAFTPEIISDLEALGSLVGKIFKDGIHRDN